MKPLRSIMIVDNNQDYCNQLRHAFEGRGFSTWTCPGPDIVESIFSAVHPNFLVLDLDLEGYNPMELINSWREMAPNTHVIVEIAVPDVRRLREAMDRGAHAFFIKSHSLTPILDLLEKEAA